MPLPWPEIRDKAVAFSREWQDAERVAFLFEMYQKYTSLLQVCRKRRKLGESEKAPEISRLRNSGQPLAEVAKNVFNECVALHS